MWWEVRDGSSVRFWDDNWLKPEWCLKDVVLQDIPEEWKNWKVCDAVNEVGRWKLEDFGNYIPERVQLRFRAVLPPMVEEGQDRLRWKNGILGEYSVKSGYEFIRRGTTQETNGKWKLIWGWRGPERIRVFLWLLMHDRLHTGMLRNKRWGASPMCSLCGECESSLHVMRDCIVAKEVWRKLVPGEKRSFFFIAGLDEWLVSNLKNGRGEGRFQWRVVFGITCWILWKARNQRLFSPDLPQSSVDNICRAAIRFYVDVTNAGIEEFRIEGQEKLQGAFKWHPPEADWFKLNTDGASKGRLGAGGCGGLVRDCCGKWIFGFAKRLGICSALEAELWGVLEGLRLCWDAGIRKLVLEVDSSVVISQIKKGQEETAMDASRLVQKIWYWYRRDWQVVVLHTPREGNKCADILANISLDLTEDIHVWHKVTREVQLEYLADCAGIWFDRGS